jgi:hypothetical protein
MADCASDHVEEACEEVSATVFDVGAFATSNRTSETPVLSLH